MNIEIIVFLIIIGIIVVLTVTEKNDAEKSGVIDFKTSHDINGDISKLKNKIKDDAKAARDTKRLFITLIIIISVVLLGFIAVSLNMILNSDNAFNKDIIKLEKDDTNDSSDKDKENNKEDKKDKDIKLDDLGDVSNYIKESQSSGECDKEVIKKDVAYRKDQIENGQIEIYLVKNNKTLKIEKAESIDKLLDDYFSAKSYEKLFVINGDGILTKYIYISKD